MINVKSKKTEGPPRVPKKLPSSFERMYTKLEEMNSEGVEVKSSLSGERGVFERKGNGRTSETKFDLS